MSDTVVRDIKDALRPLRPRRRSFLCWLGWHDGGWGKPIPNGLYPNLYFSQQHECRRCGNISVRQGRFTP